MTGPHAALSLQFDGLYRRLYPSLLRYAYRLLGDADAAEDVVQEAFVRLLSHPEVGEERARLWLFTVTTNLIRDRGRSSTRRQRLLALVPVGPAPEPLPDEVVERAERVDAARAALAQLAERDRQMLLMREEGFRYEEIAQAVGVAPGSVGTLIARALKRFTEAYRPSKDDHDPRG